MAKRAVNIERSTQEKGALGKTALELLTSNVIRSPSAGGFIKERELNNLRFTNVN